jgi:propanol-preferring alcohol dehydrogenase
VSNICNHCAPCLAGADGCCLNLKITGYGTPGTFQEYTVAPASYVTPIPEAVASVDAAPLLCGGVTAYAALRKTRAISGDWVVISGSGGGIGHLACQMGSKAMGYRILGIDRQVKGDLSRECGAEEFLAYEDFPHDGDEIVQAVKRITGGLGAAAVMICNGSDDAYSQGLRYLRFNGTLVALGCQEGAPVPISTATPNIFLFQQLNIAGSSVGNKKDAAETFNLAARGVIRARTQTEKMENLVNVFNSMHSGKSKGKIVIEI